MTVLAEDAKMSSAEPPMPLTAAEDDKSVVSQSSSKTSKASSSSKKSVKARKWGKVPVHAVIKKWAGAKSADQLDEEHAEKKEAGKGQQGEDIGQFIRREIRDYEGGVNRPTTYKESEQELKSEAFARSLHDSLLQTQVIDLGFDMFAKQYDPLNDPVMGMSFRAVAAEEARANADTGPSISKERFSSKYWNTWRKDVMILEQVSAKDNQDLPLQLNRDQIFQLKLKKIGVKGFKPNSRLPGVSFAPPKLDRSDYFDNHMMGNRNDPKRILEHSLKQPVPAYETTPALLRAKHADPGAVGVSIGGGAFQRGPRMPKERPPDTSGADIPAVDVPKGDAKLTSFVSGARVDPNWGTSTSGGASYDVKGGEIGSQSDTSKITFAREKREGVADSRATYPGPGEYDVPGMTSHIEKKDYSKLIERIDRTEGGDYRLIPAHDMGKLGGFMQGCSRQDHILYGFCLDGQCGKRTKFERAFLQTKNYKRLGAQSAEMCQLAVPAEHVPYSPKRKKKGSGDGTVTLATHGTMNHLKQEYDSPEKIAELRREWVEEQVPDAKIYMYPLHLAARRGDVHAIRKMAVLGLDINFLEGDREESPLQLATRGQHLDAVNAILDEFDGIVDIDVQNTNGDTALHIATRKGWREFVEALCGADADPLLKNLNGQTPLKEAHLFSIQQMLRMQEEVFNLRKELADATAEVQKKAEIEEARQRGTLTLDQYMTMDSNEAASKVLARAQDGRGRTSDSGTGRATSSKARPRSRLLEMHEDKFDPAVDASKVNKSLFRVVRKTTKLKDPKKNSFVLGYWPDDDDKDDAKSPGGH